MSTDNQGTGALGDGAARAPSSMTLIGSRSGYALTLVWFGWVFAGMDYTLYAYALPLILVDLHIAIPTAGVVYFLSLQGTFLGSLLVPLFADYFGRKPAMIANILLYALATGLVALAQTAFFLTLVRFVVTFGVGGEQPVGATYISEQWNPKTRGRAMGFMQSGFAIGALFATLLEATIAVSAGWRPLFIICAVPALLVVVFRFWLPESKRWQAIRDKKRTAPPVDTAPIAAAAAEAAATAEAPRHAEIRFPWTSIFNSSTWKLTLIGTILLVMGNSAGGGITAWAPTFLKFQRHLDISSVGWLGVVNSIGLLIGYNAAGWIADWISRRFSLMFFFALGAVSIVCFGLFTNIALIGVAFFVVGAAQGGQFGNFIVYLSELFPTAARASGVGWCMGIGLFFWALIPYLLSVLAPTGNFGNLFAILGGAACIIGFITSYIAPETKGRDLGAVSGGDAGTLLGDPEVVA
jgi:putative MFS transporter